MNETETAGDKIRCGARMRGGGTCERPAVRGKRRCRRHGGAPGHGAPKGNRNAEKDGLRTREAIAERRWVNALIRESRRLIEMMRRGEGLGKAEHAHGDPPRAAHVAEKKSSTAC